MLVVRLKEVSWKKNIIGHAPTTKVNVYQSILPYFIFYQLQQHKIEHEREKIKGPLISLTLIAYWVDELYSQHEYAFVYTYQKFMGTNQKESKVAWWYQPKVFFHMLLAGHEGCFV